MYPVGSSVCAARNSRRGKVEWGKELQGRGVYICCGEKKEHPTTDGINPAKIGNRRPAGTRASILEVDLDLSGAVVFGRTSAPHNGPSVGRPGQADYFLGISVTSYRVTRD